MKCGSGRRQRRRLLDALAYRMRREDDVSIMVSGRSDFGERKTRGEVREVEVSNKHPANFFGHHEKAPVGRGGAIVVLSSTQVRVHSYGYAFRGVFWYAFLVWVDTGICLACTHLLALREVCKPLVPSAVRRTSDTVPSSLYSHSQRSCEPQQRRGGGGDASSRQDTRQDR